jgi:hypothetical protein
LHPRRFGADLLLGHGLLRVRLLPVLPGSELAKRGHDVMADGRVVPLRLTLVNVT